MFVVLVTGPGRPHHRLAFDKTEVTIGSLPSCDIVLPPRTVARVHALLARSRAGIMLRSVGSGDGMWVNGRPVGAPVAVGISDRIQIGAYQLAIERAVERLPRIVGVDPVEIALIEAIEKGDHSSRLVYADWLEAHGQTTRAEFLRLQETLLVMEPEDAAFAAGIARLRELSVSIDAGWRGQLARLPT